MFSRFILKPSNLKFAALIRTRDSHIISFNLFNQDIKPRLFRETPNYYSTNRNGNGNNGEDSSHLWNFTPEIDKASNSLFDEESGNPDEFQYPKQMKPGPEPQLRSLWKDETLDTDFDDDGIFKEAEEKSGGGTTNEWATADGFQMWDFEVDEKKKEESVFVDAGEVEVEVDRGLTLQGLSETDEPKNTAEQKLLEVEEKFLGAVLKGPDRAFGDLLAASGITDELLDTLISLKSLEDIPGLPPLHDIQDARYEKSLQKSSRAELERQKQEEVAKARVRQVDDKGRAYGTGRRKCSIARVWIQPGDGRFVVNDKEFDVYFPMLDHRATLLRPFTETLTLGKWDVDCTVKGGGVSGQVGAVRLGISRALQNWAPDLRPPLREAGFLTRDSRVVERKKPGKAKARKSFQWVKR